MGKGLFVKMKEWKRGNSPSGQINYSISVLWNTMWYCAIIKVSEVDVYKLIWDVL